VRVRFATAPAWFRGVLAAEDLVLGRLRGRLPTTAHLVRTGDLADPAAIPRADVGTVRRRAAGWHGTWLLDVAR